MGLVSTINDAKAAGAGKPALTAEQARQITLANQNFKPTPPKTVPERVVLAGTKAGEAAVSPFVGAAGALSQGVADDVDILLGTVSRGLENVGMSTGKGIGGGLKEVGIGAGAGVTELSKSLIPIAILGVIGVIIYGIAKRAGGL